MKKALTLAVLVLAAGSANAAEIYAGVGTTGMKAGYVHTLSRFFPARAEYNTLDFGHDFSTATVNYDAKIKFNAGGLFVDFHPFSGALRVSAGALIGNNTISGRGVAKNGGTYTINGVTYPAAGESLTATADFPSVQPYIGVGYGFAPNTMGLGFFADVGAAIGKPKATLKASSNLANTVGAANIEAERQNLQKEVDKFRIYPVVSVGVGFAFY